MEQLDNVRPIGRVDVITPNDEPKDEKYLVLKRSELEELLVNLMGGDPPQWARDEVNSYVLEDAVVIRTHDVFSAPALHAYAHTIALVAKHGDRPELRSVSDYFHDRAREADIRYYEDESKLPD